MLKKTLIHTLSKAFINFSLMPEDLNKIDQEIVYSTTPVNIDKKPRIKFVLSESDTTSKTDGKSERSTNIVSIIKPIDNSIACFLVNFGLLST